MNSLQFLVSGNCFTDRATNSIVPCTLVSPTLIRRTVFDVSSRQFELCIGRGGG